MEIGPITGIRAVSLLNVERAENSHPRAFEIDPSARADDESYSSSSQPVDRGLEDEDSASAEDDEPDPESAVPSDQANGSDGISFFA